MADQSIATSDRSEALSSAAALVLAMTAAAVAAALSLRVVMSGRGALTRPK
jgi:hypothetical protein